MAAFARASLERLLVVQGVFALLAAGAVVWILSDGIFPVISTAVEALPDRGFIRAGKLEWTDDSPQMLAEGKILALGVNLNHNGTLRSPADFQFEFGRDSLWVYSLFGVAEFPYPTGYIFAANRHDARPAWGAWAPEILALTAIGAFFGLLLVWWALATLYFVPVWLIGFFANRNMNFWSSWKLAGAALMPGAALMTLAIFLYDLAAFDLIQFYFAVGMHLVVGWIYLFVSPMFLNRDEPAAKKNPFADH